MFFERKRSQGDSRLSNPSKVRSVPFEKAVHSKGSAAPLPPPNEINQEDTAQEVPR